MPHLIFEGSDGAGKTHLAMQIHAAQMSEGWQLEHVGPPTEKNFGTEVLKRITRFGRKDVVIWDRLYHGELVYGPLLRGKSRISPGDWNLIEAYLLTRGALTVWMDTPAYICHERCHALNRDAWLLTKFIDIHSRYQAVMKLTRLPVCKWSTIDESRKHRWLANVVERFQYHKFSFDAEGVGAMAPQVWVLGEQMNPNAPFMLPFSTFAGREIVWPAIDPRVHRVSNALRVAAKTELHMARAGAFDRSDIVDLRDRWDELMRPRVIALGKTAAFACIAADIPHEPLEHPQFIRRFYHGVREKFAATLVSKLEGSHAARVLG